jgi:WD40 repeat protein
MTLKSAVVLAASLCLIAASVAAKSGPERAKDARAGSPQPFSMRTIAIPASIKGEEITIMDLSSSGLVALGTAGGHLFIVDRNLQAWRGGWERSAGSSAIYGVSFSSDETAIAAVTSEAVLVWRLDDQTVAKIPIEESVSAIALSPGGRWLAVAKFEVSVFDVSSQRLVRKFERDIGSDGAGTYEDLAFTPDATVVAAVMLGGGTDGNNKIPDEVDAWNIESGKLAWHWQCICGADGVTLSRDAALAVVGTSDAHALLWDLASGSVLKDKTISIVDGDHVYGTAASLKGALVTAGTASGLVVVWDTVSGGIIAREQPGTASDDQQPTTGIVSGGQPITSITSSDDGQTILVVGQKAWLITLIRH